MLQPSYWSKRCNANSWLLVSWHSQQKRRLNLSEIKKKQISVSTHFARLHRSDCSVSVLARSDGVCCSLGFFPLLNHSYLLTSPDLNVKHICFVMLFCWMPRGTFSKLHGGTFFRGFFFCFLYSDRLVVFAFLFFLNSCALLAML